MNVFKKSKDFQDYIPEGPCEKNLKKIRNASIFFYAI